MNAKTVLILALVGLVAAAGVATAQPATSPNDASDTDRGPPETLPGPVPDFVGDILDLIGQKLSGALSGQELGEALSGLLGDGSAASGQSG